MKFSFIYHQRYQTSWSKLKSDALDIAKSLTYALIYHSTKISIITKSSSPHCLKLHYHYPNMKVT